MTICLFNKRGALTEKYLTKELYDAIEEVDTNEVFQSIVMFHEECKNPHNLLKQELQKQGAVIR